MCSPQIYAPILPQNHNYIATYSVALSNLYHLMKVDLLHKKLESQKQHCLQLSSEGNLFLSICCYLLPVLPIPPVRIPRASSSLVSKYLEKIPCATRSPFSKAIGASVMLYTAIII